MVTQCFLFDGSMLAPGDVRAGDLAKESTLIILGDNWVDIQISQPPSMCFANV